MRLIAAALTLLVIGACGVDEGQKANLALAAGLRLQAAGDLDGAAAQYEAAILHDSSSKLAYYDLGLVWQLRSRPDDAELDYRRCLKVDADYAPALYNLALLRGQRDPTEAELLYRHVIRLQPANAAAHYNLGLLLRQAGRTTEGDAELATARSINPALGRP